MQGMKKLGVGAFALFLSLSARADFTWNFPEPVTPMALDTLHVHNKFMLITAVIFVVVLAIMIYSIVTHRHSKGYNLLPIKPPQPPLKFSGR